MKQRNYDGLVIFLFFAIGLLFFFFGALYLVSK